ncbi:MAG: O-antigen polymerase [Eubacteriales bacterium]|nr:O-antigen polymerase [Eubacteriales bacterium]
MDVLLVVALLWLMVIFNWLRFKDFLYPALIQSFLWASAVTLFAIYQDMFYPISSTTWIVLILGVITFSLGAHLATFRHFPYKNRNYVLINEMPSNFVLCILLLVMIIFLPFMCSEANRMSDFGPFKNTFKNLRYSMTHQGESYGRLIYLVWLSFVTAGLITMKMSSSKKDTINHKVKILATLIVSIALLYAILMTGRGFILFLLLILLGVILILKTIHPALAVMLAMVLGIIVFGSYGIALDKGADSTLSLTENMFPLYQSAIIYIVGSIPALDQVISSNIKIEMGLNTFLSVNSILNKLGLNLEIRPLVQPFTSVPFLINTYTLYKPYILDFGLLGPVIFQYCFGFLHGFIYRKASVFNPNPHYVLWYGILLFPLVMQFSIELYLSWFKQWIVFLSFTLLIFTVSRLRIRKGHISVQKTFSGHYHR